MSFNHNKMYPPKYYNNCIILGFTIILALKFIINSNQFSTKESFLTILMNLLPIL